MDPNPRIEELERLVAAKDAAIADLTARLMAMEARITAMQRRIFGRSSEQLHDSGQQTLDFLTKDASSPFVDAAATAEVAAAATSEPSADTDSAEVPIQRRKRGKRLGRLPDHVEVTERVIDVPEAERLGTDGLPLVRLTDEITERLDYVPSHYRRLRIIRPVYGRPFADGQVQPRMVAASPVFLVEKGIPTDALAIQVFIAKYADHLPLYRQSAIAARQGIALPRSTLCGWIGALADRLKPVWEAIGAEVRAGPYLHLDDTPIRVLRRDRCLIGRLWTYGVPDAVHLRYAPSRAGSWPGDFLRGYRGYVMGDAYAGHHQLFTDGTRTAVACWVHARRNFIEICDQEPEALAMVRRIAVLYAIEKKLREAGADPETILAARKREALPQLAIIKTHLNRLALTVTPRSPLGKAVNYALTIWDALMVYATAGIALPIDNNLAERSIRPVAIGRKNYLFLGSGENGGGDWAAIAYSLIGSCQLNGIDPVSYLTNIAPHLSDWRFTDHATLTPRAWARRTRAKTA